jgi:ABC-type uncharacterized transport system involved in gliding motility auxiliary subunit
VQPFFSKLKKYRNLTAVLGLISLFLAGLVGFFLPELIDSVVGLLLLGLMLLTISVLGSLTAIKEFMAGKRSRYWLNTMAMIAVFIAGMIMANYLGATHHRRFDLTASDRFTLADQTINIIKGLESPIQAIGFFSDDPHHHRVRAAARNLFEEYRHFNRRFSFKFVDPEVRPAVARQYRVSADGSIVFVSGSRQKTVREINEQTFTSALLEVTGIQTKKIYFSSGHGERDINDHGPAGCDLARRGLIRELYQVETLHPASTAVIPADCAVLVIAGPQKAFQSWETEAIKNYLRRNGKVLLLVDPNPPAEVNLILRDWGITIGKGRITEQKAYAVPDKNTPAVFKGNYPPVIITTGLDTTYFREATAVMLTGELSRVLKNDTEGQDDRANWPLTPIEHENLVILPAVLTTTASWLQQSVHEADAAKIGKIKGPLALASLVIARAPLIAQESVDLVNQKLTRLAIFGDSDFISNAHIPNGGNGDLFLNAVSWLAEEASLINIRPKQVTFTRLVISAGEQRFIRYSSVGLLPLLALIVGVGLWWRNR